MNYLKFGMIERCRSIVTQFNFFSVSKKIVQNSFDIQTTSYTYVLHKKKTDLRKFSELYNWR